jgi:hypothetical protein
VGYRSELREAREIGCLDERELVRNGLTGPSAKKSMMLIASVAGIAAATWLCIRCIGGKKRLNSKRRMSFNSQVSSEFEICSHQ